MRESGFSAGRWILCLVVVATAATVPLAAWAADGEAVPPGVQMLLPRGGIPAILDPAFVPADSAEIPDDAWVLGVAIDGEARAYSLNLLNHHEVVNDVVAGRPVAAVW